MLTATDTRPVEGRRVMAPHHRTGEQMKGTVAQMTDPIYGIVVVRWDHLPAARAESYALLSQLTEVPL